MWIFFTLVGLGLAFMVYALVQFHGEVKGHKRQRRHKLDTKSEIAGKRRLLHMSSKQAADSGKTGSKGWSHGNGEIRFRSTSTTGDVFIRRIRASAEPKSGVREKSRNSSRTGCGYAKGANRSDAKFDGFEFEARSELGSCVSCKWE
jgi:hypothetical protein